MTFFGFKVMRNVFKCFDHASSLEVTSAMPSYNLWSPAES